MAQFSLPYGKKQLAFELPDPLKVTLLAPADVPAAAFVVMVLGALWCVVYLTAAALVLRRISDYGSFGFADFFSALKKSIRWLSSSLMDSMARFRVLFWVT